MLIKILCDDHVDMHLWSISCFTVTVVQHECEEGCFDNRKVSYSQQPLSIQLHNFDFALHVSVRCSVEHLQETCSQMTNHPHKQVVELQI